MYHVHSSKAYSTQNRYIETSFYRLFSYHAYQTVASNAATSITHATAGGRGISFTLLEREREPISPTNSIFFFRRKPRTFC